MDIHKSGYKQLINCTFKLIFYLEHLLGNIASEACNDVFHNIKSQLKSFLKNSVKRRLNLVFRELKCSRNLLYVKFHMSEILYLT